MREKERKIRVLQLIDSLRPGGAEKMAVSYANALAKENYVSYLCCTRLEGILTDMLTPEVGYIFLGKRSVFDLKALLKLRRFIKENRVNLIHAHGTSIFSAVLLKGTMPGIKLVWHDHLGARAIENKSPGLLKPASLSFNGVIVVNDALSVWAKKNLYCSNVLKIRNFLPEASLPKRRTTEVKMADSFKVVCVANFRREKDHFNLIQAFSLFSQVENNSSLHLIGSPSDKNYFEEVQRRIATLGLKKKVFIYGEQADVIGLIRKMDLGVLSSYSEGLPVALLEYGSVGLPVICTDVGDCASVLGGLGKLVIPRNPTSLSQAILEYHNNKEERIAAVHKFNARIKKNYSQAVIIKEVLLLYRNILFQQSA